MFFSSRRGSWRIWFVIGLGLALYGYYDSSRIDDPDDAELERRVETQYRTEVVRLQEQAGDMPIHLSAEWEEKFRGAIRREHKAPIEKAQKKAQSVLGAGLILLVLAAGMFVYEQQTEKQQNPKKF